MREKILIKKKEYTAHLIYVEKKHQKELRSLYNKWKSFSEGTKSFGRRRANLHEAISETAFALAMNCPLLVSISGTNKFDNYNPRTHSRIQVKASGSDKGPSTFGPRSQYDELYWLNFFRDGKYDGNFDIYKVNRFVKSIKVSKSQTAGQQQKKQRRPRFRLGPEFYKKYKMRKIKTFKI